FPKEPTAIRYFLSGNGNFAEVNSLFIAWPDEVTVVSQRGSTIGSGIFQTKTFEYVVTIENDHSVVIPPVNFVYFSPVTNRYETAIAESVRMDPMKRMAEEQTFIPVDLPLEKTYTVAKPFTQHPALL